MYENAKCNSKFANCLNLQIFIGGAFGYYRLCAIIYRISKSLRSIYLNACSKFLNFFTVT